MKSLLELRTSKATFSIPLSVALVKLWYGVSYPLQIAAGYVLFGYQGAALVFVLIILNFRGKL